MLNESEMLQEELTEYYKRTGRWPKCVLTNQINRTRANIAFCKEYGVRISDPKLGRRPKDEKQKQSDRKTAYKDNTDRIGVESFFGLGKWCNGMGLITIRLEETSATVISLSVLVMNLFRHTGALYFFVFYLFYETDELEHYFALLDVYEDKLGA